MTLNNNELKEKIEEIKKEFTRSFDIDYLKDRIQHEYCDDEELCSKAIWNFLEPKLTTFYTEMVREKELEKFVAWVKKLKDTEESDSLQTDVLKRNIEFLCEKYREEKDE